MKKFNISTEGCEIILCAENFEIKEGYLFLIAKKVWVAVIAPGHWRYIVQYSEKDED